MTIITMSDTCIGGKVRLNDIQDGDFVKNAYRSCYEPSEILVDPQFLEGMTEHQIRYGLCKIMKHALYQSDGLLEYLLSDKIEQESGPILSHGEAVLQAMAMDLHRTERFTFVVQLYRKFGIPLPQ